MTVSINGTTGLTFNDSTSQTTAATCGLVNKIINSDMMIDQRNAGASVNNTAAGLGTYTVDRWLSYGTAATKFSIQQNAGAVTPPAGFSNYLGVTSLAATAVGASDLYYLTQRLEGFNVADLGWGTANAQPVTLSFWVRSSLTGTFGGALLNSAGNRSYPFSYTISSANTWTQISITVAGDTTGTWLTNNGIGIAIVFGLGIGSTYNGTAGAWAGATYLGATGATSVVGTNGATFYITGVDLRKGTTGATAQTRDVRPYGTELALCQRYYEILTNDATNGFSFLSSVLTTTASSWGNWVFKQTKRASPTVGLATGNSWTNITPTIYPTIDHVLFQGSNYFHNTGAANTAGITASAEL